MRPVIGDPCPGHPGSDSGSGKGQFHSKGRQKAGRRPCSLTIQQAETAAGLVSMSILSARTELQLNPKIKELK